MNNDLYIDIYLATQTLQVRLDGRIVFETRISSARNGPGEQNGSECTPCGEHIVYEIIGEDAPVNTVFVGREPTGEVYTPELGEKQPERDWILTRIIWLAGNEVGKNRMGTVDTLRRYIYIHGCPDSCETGVALSHGCVRMHNDDLLALMPFVQQGMRVMIHA